MDLPRGFQYYLPLEEAGIAFSFAIPGGVIFWNLEFIFWNLTSYAGIEVDYCFLNPCFRRARLSALSTPAAISMLTS